MASLSPFFFASLISFCSRVLPNFPLQPILVRRELGNERENEGLNALQHHQNGQGAESSTSIR